MRARAVTFALRAVTSWGCSSGGTTRSEAGAAPKASRQQDLITESEISTRASDAANALQIVQKLRPQMLRGRGRVSPNDPNGEASLPRVFVDDVAFGNIDNLANITANQIREIRFVSATDATTKWGTGYMGGVIVVTTKK